MRDDTQLTKADYELLSSLLHRDYGVDLNLVSPAGLQATLSRYRERHGLGSITECIEHASAHSQEAGGLGDIVYPCRTWFNRSPEHFEFLVRRVRQFQLISHTPTTRDIVIWSAACSTGQEAYTIAIYLLDSLFEDPRTSPSFRVIGSDCSRASLRHAREGRYTVDDVSRLAPIPYERYFAPDDQGTLTVRQPVRDRVSFTRLNLVASEYPFYQEIDFVFLRNALDHHMPSSRDIVLKKLHRVFKLEGCLVFGHCHGLDIHDLRRLGYEPIADQCYQAVAT